MAKKVFKYIGFIAFIGLSGAIAGVILHWAILEILQILGLCGIREYVASIDGSSIVMGGTSGLIAGIIGFGFLEKKTG